MHKAIVVDDETHMLQGWRTMVDWRSCGYELQAALDDPQEALAVIEHEEPDLVITDIRMPGMCGHELIQTIREKLDLSSRIVIMTGYADFQYVKRAMPFKIDRFLLKPIIPEEIHVVLRELSLVMADMFSKVDASSSDDDAVTKAIRYLRRHYHQDVKIKQLADYCGYHPVYFGQLFKQKTGTSIQDFTHRLRIQEAQKLLLQTNMKIAAVADLLGYHDADYFTSIFKKFTNLTPSSFKNLKLR